MKITRRHWLCFFALFPLVLGTCLIGWRRLSTSGVGEPRRRVPQWESRHNALTQLLKTNSYGVVFFGDSIVQQWESTGRKVWDEVFEPFNSLNAGFGGDHTANLLWHLQNGFLEGQGEMKLAVVLIGTNDIRFFPKKAEENIRMCLEEILKRKPGVKILLLGILPRGEMPDNALRKVNAGINAAIAKFADNQRVFYKDVGTVFLAPNGVLKKEFTEDFIHLTEAGYRAWAGALLPDVRMLLSQ